MKNVQMPPVIFTLETFTPLYDSLSEPEKQSLHQIITELNNAKAKHPRWPADLVHASAVVAEESGELVRASLMLQFEDKDEKSIQRGHTDGCNVHPVYLPSIRDCEWHLPPIAENKIHADFQRLAPPSII